MKPESTSSKIHPELRQVAKKSPAIDFNKGNIRFIDFMMSIMFAPRKSPGVSIENIYIPVADGRRKIRLRVYKPASASTSTPALLWLHGGGYVIGRPEMDDLNCIEFVKELGLTVISVDYRLAPRHPFPAGLDDAHTALQWTSAHAQELNIEPSRIAIGGQSAGGGLAAALAQMAHDRGEIPLAFQLLVYPMLDDRTALRVDLDDSENATWTQNSNRFAWKVYLNMEYGSEDEDIPPYAAPARRNDLSGLPPAWIGVGTLDIFHAENVVYQKRLLEAGVECELLVVPGAFHGFDRFEPNAPVVRDFQRAQISALKKYLS